jgi:xylulokinase
MAMLCYKNGSLTRERVMKESGGGSWESFAAHLASTPPGNSGALGFFVDAPEITPAITKAGVRRFSNGLPVKSFANPSQEVRAVVEGQFLSMRIHGESVGIVSPKRLIATGGASGNAAILQVLADVFGAPVYTAAQTDSASLGAAVRALHGDAIAAAGGKFIPVERLRPAGSGGLKHAADPRAAATKAYTALIPAYKAAEAMVCSEK